jgi:hypothetical protein
MTNEVAGMTTRQRWDDEEQGNDNVMMAVVSGEFLNERDISYAALMQP